MEKHGAEARAVTERNATTATASIAAGCLHSLDSVNDDLTKHGLGERLREVGGYFCTETNNSTAQVSAIQWLSAGLSMLSILSLPALSEPMKFEDSDVLAMFIKVSCAEKMRSRMFSERAEGGSGRERRGVSVSEPVPACPPSS